MSRILHLIHSTAFGGGPAMVELICTRLQGSEFEMSLVSDGQGDLPARLASAGVRVTALPLTDKGSFARNIPRLAGVIRRESPDLVHVHGHWAASLGQLALQLAGRPATIYSVQWPAYLDDTNLYSRARNWIAEGLACRLAARVVAVSNADRQTLARRRLASPHKLTVIYNSFDPRKFSSLGAPSEGSARTSGGAVLGFVGRLADQKGCEFLIEAMPAVIQAHPQVRLRIVGDGPDRPRLDALVKRLHLSPSVEFLGYQPASSAVMAGFDALIVPSIYDVHPLVAVEAMACGLPVVASAVGGLAETVVDGKTGFLVAPRRPDQLASAINRLLTSETLRRSMGVEARRRALEQFSPEVCVAAYAAEYRALLARRPAPGAPRT
jgi:glycosyltransferase involved in cell wall biosynthesis